MINLDSNKKYLLACSFGPDSMALFDMLEKSRINFSVAHVNYNLRPESSKETRDLLKYCKSKNIEIFIEENDVKIKKNVEEKCREIRYEFFKEIYHKCGFDALLIAHNQDDHIETYLMQQKRKNLVLFYGISCKTSLFSMNVIRPLLDFKKSSLQSYCDENLVPYCIDLSNLGDDYLRNQIRHNIVEKLNDNERSEILKEIDDKNSQLKSVLNKVDAFNSYNVLDLLKVEDEVLPYLLNKLARNVNDDIEISSRLCNEIKKALLSDKPNVVVKLKKDFAFLKEYESFKFDYLEPVSYEFVVNLGDVIDNEYLFFDTNLNLEKRNLSQKDFPLTISNPKNGDEVRIKDYKVQIRRLFIDWKMPLSLRERWPIIRNNKNEIVYVPRYQKDFKKENSNEFFVKI